MSHDQAQVECGFRTNAKLLVKNQNTGSLIAKRIIHDHMRFHKHQPHTIKITIERKTMSKKHEEGTSITNRNVL